MPNVLKENPQIHFLFKKAEAITSAIYLLSSLLSDQEPLKWRLRTLCSDILESALSFFSQGVATDVLGLRSRETIERDTMLLCSFLAVLVRGRALSDRNVELVTREIEVWVQLFSEAPRGLVEKMQEETKALFTIASQSTTGVAPRTLTRNSDAARAVALPKIPTAHPVAHDASSGAVGEIQREEEPTLRAPSPSGVFQSQPGVRPLGHENERPARFSGEAAQRRSLIIDLVRARGRVTVKDVARMLPQYSGKTAQRELVTLVGEAVLRREGARRWSRYSLNSPIGPP